MGWVADGALADLFDNVEPERLALRIAEAVQDDMHRGMVDRTPVAELPLAYKGNLGAWIEDRKRRPGTLRSRWEKEPLKVLPGPRVIVAVENTDPVAIHVEEDTRPHVIRPRRAKALRFPLGTIFRFATKVNHPGSQGQHMARDTMAEIEATWPRTAERVLREELR